MSRRKCFFSCEKKHPLFGLPREDVTRRLWIRFAFPDLPPRRHTNINLCALHFTHESFVNRAQYNAGFSARLLLKEGAVPTLPGQSGPAVTIKQEEPGDSFTPRFLHVGCQTDPPPTKSVGTQLCMRTLKEHVQSKGIQVQITSTLAKNYIPPKRPHRQLLEEEEEEETEPSEINYFQANPLKNRPRPSSSKIILSSTTSKNVPRQQQSAGSSSTKLQTGSVSSVQSSEDDTSKDPNQDVCQRAQKQHNCTENRLVKNKENGGTEAEDDHSRSVCVSDGHCAVDLESSSQLIVDEECIVELFKKCLECNRQCRVTKRVDGLRLVMHQSCYFCHYQYKWSNQPEMDEEDVLQTDAAQWRDRQIKAIKKEN